MLVINILMFGNLYYY